MCKMIQRQILVGKSELFDAIDEYHVAKLTRVKSVAINNIKRFRSFKSKENIQIKLL